MAYLIDPLEEKKKQDASQGLGTSGAVGSNIIASGSQGNAVVDTKAPTSSGFVNLQSYLDANKGASEAVAQNITKKVAADADSYSGQAVATAKKVSDDTTESIKQTADAAQKAGNGISGGGKDYQAAGGILGSEYGGPKAAAYSTDLKLGMDAVNERLNKVDDNAMQQTMLRDTYGKDGNYSSGFANLDTFLIGNDAAAQKHLGEVKAKTAGVTKSYGDSLASIGHSEATGIAGLDASKKALKGTISGRIGDIDDAAARVMLGKNSTNTNYDNFQVASMGDGLQSGDLDELAALNSLIGGGFDPAQYGKTHNVGSAPVKKVAPVVAPVAAPIATPAAASKSSSPVGSAIKWGSEQGSGAVDSILNAPENISKAAKTPSAPVVKIPKINTVVNNGQKQLKKWGF